MMNEMHIQYIKIIWLEKVLIRLNSLLSMKQKSFKVLHVKEVLQTLILCLYFTLRWGGGTHTNTSPFLLKLYFKKNVGLLKNTLKDWEWCGTFKVMWRMYFILKQRMKPWKSFACILNLWVTYLYWILFTLLYKKDIECQNLHLNKRPSQDR